jgi:hypothetical protein
MQHPFFTAPLAPTSPETVMPAFAPFLHRDRGKGCLRNRLTAERDAKSQVLPSSLYGLHMWRDLGDGAIETNQT